MSDLPEFIPFPKIARFSRGVIVTEKIDGTNASVFISEDSSLVLAGSRNRWLTVEQDNFNFARWVAEHREELLKLGPGHHFGEWWGSGIQRGYGLKERRFSLFNTSRWLRGETPPPACCSVVPELWTGRLDDFRPLEVLEALRVAGSSAAPGFMRPEGVVIWHSAGRLGFKKTFEKDDEGKGP